MQEEALENLKILRSNNQTKGLVISSTGTGKPQFCERALTI